MQGEQDSREMRSAKRRTWSTCYISILAQGSGKSQLHASLQLDSQSQITTAHGAFLAYHHCCSLPP